MGWWKRSGELLEEFAESFDLNASARAVQQEISDRINITERAISAAPDNYGRAQAAMACNIKHADNKLVFGDRALAYSMLALTDELRKSRGL